MSEHDLAELRKRRSLAAAEEEIDSMMGERIMFLETHLPPYSEEEQSELNRLNELVIDGLHSYYKRKRNLE
jgi:hypothetical protein